MGRPLYTNNAATYLAFGITNTATTMQVSANAGNLFPNPTSGDYFYVSLISLSGPIIEIVKCTARSGDIFTIERGQEGTTPLYWNMGDNVQLRITAAGMNYIAGAAVQSTEEQVFTATQGQTVFTLTNFDYAPGTNNLAVFVNGSKQVYGTNYSETSVNTVTFNSGLNAGDIVEFLVGISVASGTLYANEINYNEGGVGAVTTTVQAKLQEFVSVTDFGAKGDGTTDDTAAIQAAINSGVGSVYFPTGTYIVSGITLVSNQKLYGNGSSSIIKSTNATADATQGVFNATSISNVEICDLKFQGINRPQNNVSTNQDGDRGINLSTCTNINIHDNFVTGFWSFGIVCSGCTNALISNNLVTSIGNQSCIAFDNSSSYGTITGNICRDGKLYGIEIENLTSQTSVTGNTIFNCVAGIAINYSNHITVSGNNINSCNNTNTISGSNGIGLFYNGTSANPLFDIVTTGNTVTDCVAYSLIISGGHQNMVFSGNLFKKGATDTTNKLVEIVLATGTNKQVNFEGNTFDCYGTSVAFTANTISEYRFEGNSIYNPTTRIFTFLNTCADNNFEIPKIASGNVASVTLQELLPATNFTNWFYSTDQAEQFCPLTGGTISRNMYALRNQQIVVIYWCINANATTGTWVLKVNGTATSGTATGVVNQEVWNYQPLNQYVAAGSSTLIEAANTIGNTYGNYAKFHLVVI